MNRSTVKVCRFCEDKALTIDYKDARMMQRFVTERGKIIPRRVSGTCARHQRSVTGISSAHAISGCCLLQQTICSRGGRRWKQEVTVTLSYDTPSS